MDLSIIVTSRNDGHGGNLVERTNLFLHTTDQLCRDIEAEIVMVEWNPPEGPLLREELDPVNMAFRTIVVPPGVHQSYKYGELLSIYQMIAKNVGIRRVKADWILATNPDLVYTPEVFRRIRVGLDARCAYRIPRVDVHTTELPGSDDVYEIIDWMKSRPQTKYAQPWQDGIVTMACGDFTLLHKDAWFALRGYPELDMWSPHIDSMLLSQAVACGYQQVFWDDAAAYHIDHLKSLSTEPQYQQTYPTVELAKVDQAYKHARTFWLLANSMGSGLHPMCVYNDQNWGWPGIEFEEIE